MPKAVDLNTIVMSVEKLLRRLIGEDIELSTRLTGQRLIVMADAGQIEQVLMNLATNARDAMPGGGELSISTVVKVIGKDSTDDHGLAGSGDYARITVSDNGSGMDEATQAKIFEPFFTTKEQGKGTGLGLAMVYGIVKQHEGSISVSSQPGLGTTFRIFLPLIALEAEEAAPETSEMPPRGSETLLLAEDDQDVRVLTTTVLSDFGYRVIEAVDGKDALEKYRMHATEIDLLILDVIMPKLSGKEVHDAVKAIHPGTKTLFISGYAADFINGKGLFKIGTQFIAKPVSPFELLKKIRSILDEASFDV
jgi:CheY-like chemotaxis protein/two-component sensor histidine kinase